MLKVKEVMLKSIIKSKKDKTGVNGVKTIKKIVGQFQGLIDGLQKGIKECEQSHSTNKEIIQVIQDENQQIEQSIQQATVFGDNLQSMLVVKNKNLSCENEKTDSSGENEKVNTD